MAVLKLYDHRASEFGEEILPLADFRSTGSLYLNSVHVRRSKGVRAISVRLFDHAAVRIDDQLLHFDQTGAPSPPPHRRPDGSIVGE